MNENEKFQKAMGKWLRIWNEQIDGTPEMLEEAKKTCEIIPLFKFRPQTAAATCVFMAAKKNNKSVSIADFSRITLFSRNTIYNIKDYIEKRK